VVAALQNSWYSSAHKLWQEAQSVRGNLQAVLQVRFLSHILQSTQTAVWANKKSQLTHACRRTGASSQRVT
jgi:hypothetical protein